MAAVWCIGFYNNGLLVSSSQKFTLPLVFRGVSGWKNMQLYPKVELKYSNAGQEELQGENYWTNTYNLSSTLWVWK